MAYISTLKNILDLDWRVKLWSALSAFSCYNNASGSFINKAVDGNAIMQTEARIDLLTTAGDISLQENTFRREESSLPVEQTSCS